MKSRLLLVSVSGILIVDLFFCHAFANFLVFTDTRTEDRPKSPVAASSVDPIPQETPQQEVEKPTEGSTAVIRGILDCQSVLTVSARLLCIVLSSICLDCVLVTGAG